MTETKKPQGFAALTPERRTEIASLGGKAAHAQGVGHQWTKETAAVAGRKGGTIAALGRMRLRNRLNPRDVAILGGEPSL
jgi:uncharacterized protein